ncbi:MAG: hypothetical protein HYU80_04550 [Candidatus Blackburnbacteria bacterium]|nr:hypothetical protein [Candidatus Blackburnbacteria bacterium]
MSSHIVLLLATIFSLVQGPLLPPVFLEGFLLVLIFLSINHSKEFVSSKTLFLVFGLSFTFDLIQGTKLGLTPILFFGVLLFWTSTKKEFFSKNPFFLGSLVVLSNLLRAKVVFGEFYFWSTLTIGFLSFLFFKYISRHHVVGYKV